MRLSHTTINDDNINNNYFYHMAKSVFHSVIGQFAVRKLLSDQNLQNKCSFSRSKSLYLEQKV